MRTDSTRAAQALFETFENRLLLSASAVHRAHPHHAAHVAVHSARAAAVHPVVHAAAVQHAASSGSSKGDPIYMKFGTVSGEVGTKGYAGQIELNSFQWGVGRGISSPTGGSSDRQISAPSISEITITKVMDKTSPVLLQDMLDGKATPEVDIFFVNNVNSPKALHAQTYAEYVLSNVLISGYSVSSGGDRPTESLTLNFTKVQFSEFPITSAGISTTPVTTVYDLTKAQLG